MALKQNHSLEKGLRCLGVINTHGGLTATECAALIALPRTTAFRLLETLKSLGYLVREEDGRYRAASLVRTLSCGFDEEEWVTNYALPELRRLSERITWSTGVATPDGLYMQVRATNDLRNPLSLGRVPPGFRFSMITSSTGLSYLAFLPEKISLGLMDAALAEAEAAGTPIARTAVMAWLQAARDKGYSQVFLPSREVAISAPIFAGEHLVGSCGVKYIASAQSEEDLQRTVIPGVKQCAKNIGDELLRHRYRAEAPGLRWLGVPPDDDPSQAG